MMVMEEITFSIGNHGAVSMSNLQLLLQKFEQQYGIHVRLDIISDSSLRWSSLVEAALYHTGPDISEVGNTWVGDLVRMEALRPFQPEEVDEITMGVHYFDAVRQSRVRTDHGVSTSYSIPLSADVRVVFYRRDSLEKAGIDEATAFESFAHLEKTLAILKEKGISVPLALPNRRSSLTLQCIASWIWGAGGDFLSPDGTSLAFDLPKALEGCKAYYRLMRFLGPDMRNLEKSEAYDAFGMGKAAVLLSGFWVPTNDLAAVVRKNLGAAPMPGTPFVGGGDLVIWNHSRHESSALKLIQFFHTKEAGKLLYPWFGLPISEEDWINPPFDTEIYQVFRAAIQKGRGFPTARLWGLVEKRLTDAYSDIWADVLTTPESQLDTIVEGRLNNLARRLQLSLGSN
jgi:multiple sugar transport system substrate-binding protein